MADVIFDNLVDAATTIQAPRYPDEPGRSYPQIVGETPGGGMRVADLGDGSTIHNRKVLHFRRLPNADMTALQAFIEVDVLFHKTLFTYTDPESNAFTSMRYMGGWEQRRRSHGPSSGVWDVDLVIQQDLDP